MRTCEQAAAPGRSPRVALVTYSTKPARRRRAHARARGGDGRRRRAGARLSPWATRPRLLPAESDAPVTLVPRPAAADTLEETVFASVDALEDGPGGVSRTEFDVLHTQDCISARAAARVRDAGRRPPVVRTVHHVDDFTTAALIDCQRRAILEPDQLVVVSEDWRRRLRADYGVEARRRATTASTPAALRRRSTRAAGRRCAQRSALRTASCSWPSAASSRARAAVFLFEALAALRGSSTRRRRSPWPAGTRSRTTRRTARTSWPCSPASASRSAGTSRSSARSPTPSWHAWYRSADALAFPSVKEGFGLAVLEAMTADLPVVASDLAVLREYLTDRETAILTRTGDPASLAAGMRAVVTDERLRADLVAGGRALVPRFSWARAAREHAAFYAVT